MFNKEEIKEFIVKLGKRFIFPEVSNVISRRVLAVGGIIVLGVNPYSIVIFNWLIDTLNNSDAVGVPIPHINNERADYIWGVVLIILVMLHNISYQWFKFYQDKVDKQNSHDERMALAERDEQQRIRSLDEEKVRNGKRMKADNELFERFLSIFPSNSLSAELLRDHDFWNSYHGKCTEQIDKFVDLGVTEETKFLDDEIEKARDTLWKECHSFVYELARHSGVIHTGPMFRVIPDIYVGVSDTPQWLDDRIKALNEQSSKCFELHQSFIHLCRRKLNR